jgi:hypothetical protein
MVEQSIQEGIRHVLGESGLAMVLSLHPLSRVSSDPLRFHELLIGIFREDGAAIIEMEIATRLLEKFGSDGGEQGRSFLSRLAATFSRAKSSGGASTREGDAFRQFLALESVRKSRSAEDGPGARRWTNRSRSFELVSPGSVLAFKN